MRSFIAHEWGTPNFNQSRSGSCLTSRNFALLLCKRCVQGCCFCFPSRRNFTPSCYTHPNASSPRHAFARSLRPPSRSARVGTRTVGRRTHPSLLPTQRRTPLRHAGRTKDRRPHHHRALPTLPATLISSSHRHTRRSGLTLKPHLAPPRRPHHRPASRNPTPPLPRAFPPQARPSHRTPLASLAFSITPRVIPCLLLSKFYSVSTPDEGLSCASLFFCSPS